MRESSPTLEYGPQSVISGLVVSQHGETVVAEIVFTWQRALRAAAGPILWGAGMAGLMLAIVWFMQLFMRRDRMGSEWIWALLPAPIGVLLAITGVLRTLRPIRFEASPEALTCTVRWAFEVEQARWMRDEIAELRVERFRVEQMQSWPRLTLVMRRQDGSDVALALGTRTELQALFGALRRGLRLEEDPLGASRYPVPPRGYRRCRRLLPGGMVLTFGPRYQMHLAAAIVGIFIAAATFMLGPKLLGEWFRVTGGLRALQALGVASIAVTLTYWLIATLGRTTTIIVRNGYVTLKESGLPRPCHLEWSPEEVGGIRLAWSNDDPPARRGALEIVPNHGLAVRTLEGKRRHVLEWVIQSVRVAMTLPPAALDLGMKQQNGPPR